MTTTRTASGTGSGLVDARPIRPVSNAAAWDSARNQCEHIASVVRETLAKEQLEAAVFVSQYGTYPPWVKLEAWLPAHQDSFGRERVDLTFTVNVKPYHEHNIVTSAQLKRGKKAIAVSERPSFHNHHVADWVHYALGRGGKPGNYRPWRDMTLGILASMVPFARGPHSNRLERQYQTRFTAPIALTSGSVVLLLMAYHAIERSEPLLGFILALLGFGGLIAAVVVVRFRKRSVWVMPQSDSPPRHLGLVDSWHAVVGELGRDFTNARLRLADAVTKDAEPGVRAQTEIYTHRSPNGYEQRERLVLLKDQGVVHIHIYQFGHDIFVGWHAYLNWLQWGETPPISTKIDGRQEIEFRAVQPTVYIPNQFDLIDLSSLSEFVHRRIEREIKAMLKEKAIDQEIDFKVIRGDRDRALDQERHQGQEKKGKGWAYRPLAS